MHQAWSCACLLVQSNDCQEQAMNDLLPQLATPACCPHLVGSQSQCEDRLSSKDLTLSAGQF